MKTRSTKYIGEFKAPKLRPNQYKTTDGFLNALYVKNRELLSSKGVTKAQFKSRVKSIMEEGFTRREAARRYSRTRTFLSKENVGLQNIRDNLTRETALEIRRSSGHYRKGINWSEYRWSDQEQGYVHVSGTHKVIWGVGDDSNSENFIDIIRL